MSDLANHTVLAAVLIVVGSTALGVAGLLGVLRLTPRALRSQDTEVKAAFLSMVGVLYAILLAFVVVAVWSAFTDAAKTSQDEVTRLANIMRDAGPLDGAERVALRRSVLTYARAVVDDEWKTMADGRESPAAAAAYQDIWSAHYRLHPTGAAQQAFYGEAVTRLNDLGANRRLRIISSRSTVPMPMWILLIAGFAASTVFTYLFDFSSLTIHVLSVATITGLTAFVLFLIFALQHPFAGSIAVSPAPYVELLHQWGPGTLGRQ